MSTTTTPRPDPRVARSRSKVLAAASELLQRGGPSALTVEAVVQRSGVARMTVYRHWPTAQTLLIDAFRTMMPDADPHVLHAETAVGRLHELVRAYGRDFAEEPWSAVMPALLERAASDPDLDTIRLEFAEARGRRLAGLLQECADEGAITGDTDLELAIAELMGPISFRRFLSFQPIPDAFCDQVVDDFLRAHAPGP